ncbi:MAG TPA: fluoride efflux transporter CrcB [Gammaproteobacteria bacterium]|uniref:Fluoride-specific ion channel FluC n=1 Tax=OM182 bacterium TaxID=2510334 RepID=A0A520RVK6_9GAMM|nr:MAG: fluoride efflux transporter CrcB [OM182 bacterium]HAU24560.1 fluoride efflux transporter CrcB [Gammaproteobacteria bacterium]HCI88334.1 fluoride efflux transporter CrcB [Gammaproteobacteria bacterium]|tara:strand:- start:404 stop:781 length:378 start_codon:yes stop_codon:yes gene_type:complete
MPTYVAIAIGGAFGAVIRYWLSTSVEHLNGSTFPLGTFSVNVFGSFLMGALFILFMEKAELIAAYRPLLAIGFLGAMTTFSTFSLDAFLLFQQGHYNTALFYVLSSVIICIFAVYFGMLLARAVL